MSLFGNPMLAGHSRVSRFVGLERANHVLRHIGGGRFVARPRADAHIPQAQPIVSGVNKFLGSKYRMPQRKYRRRARRTRRKLYRRKRRTVQPYAITRNLKSVVAVTLNPAAGGAIATIGSPWVKLNSAYDPTGVLGAGQPLGYDQYTALYKRAGVVKWSAKLELCTVDNAAPISVGITPTVSGTALSNYNHYKELPGTKSAIITPDVDKMTIFVRGGVKRYFMPKSGRLLSDERATHAIGADPSDLLYAHIWAQPMDQSSDAGVIHGILTLWQTVVFFQPEVPARS